MLIFHARCLPINYLHNKHCTLCNEEMGKDPNGHLFFSCKKTKQFIEINKLKNFIFITIAIDYDLSRSFTYKNLIALILHNIWIWICNQLYSDIPPTDITLSYNSLLKKWHKLATLEYIKKANELKIVSAKDHNNFKDPNILLTLTTKLRKITANQYYNFL
ncbi:hypothetical protein ACTFIV_006660 [Dictyostelium citrinum]